MMPQTLTRFRKQFPEVWKAYANLRDTCTDTGPLDEKTVELIKVGISAALGREGGLVAHVSRARKAGASPAETYQAILQGMGLTGFPTILAAFQVVHEVFKRKKRTR
ncbi:MAG TPA: carboxymuconolactone decarboxylase family protein [Nitrospiria bacterium]|jgi:AhpD family alkylhydroperoxidase